jgi:hypothetical protein
MKSVKPPVLLLKTWLDIYYSQTRNNNTLAQTAVERRIFESFDSLYDAEMYLHRLDLLKPVETLA